MRSLWALFAGVTLLSAWAPAFAFTAFPICPERGDWQLNPVVSGTLVVWNSLPDGGGNPDIWAKDLSGGGPIPICVEPAIQDAVTVGDRYIVWQDNRTGEFQLFAYDTSTQITRQITASPAQPMLPDVSGSTVVWADFRTSLPYPVKRDIYAQDIATGVETPVCTSDYADNQTPAISGNIVVWMDGRNRGLNQYNWDIYGYDLATGREFAICEQTYPQGDPRVSGNIVVWVDVRNDKSDLYAYDIANSMEFPIAVSPGYHEQPDIDGSIVVWTDNRNGNFDIYGFDISTGREFPIYTGLGNQQKPRVSGDLVIWEDDSVSPPHVYGAYIPEPTSMALLLLGLGFLRKGKR